MENYGALCLLPAIVVIITAMVTKRSLEALVLGVIAGCIIIEGGNFYQLLCKSFFH